MINLKLEAPELNDANFCYKYDETAQIITEIEEYLSQEEINNSDYLVWECENTVISAIAIIYFLTNNYSFLLIPANIDAQIPNFCRYILKASQVEITKINWEIKANSHWNGKQADASYPYIYMRTSGTTGTPKLIAHSHDKLWQNAKICAERLGLKKSDRMAIPVPIYHLFGLGAGFLSGVLVGVAIDLQANANLLKYLQREKIFNPNIAFMTPTFAQTLLKARKTSRPYKFTVMAGDRISVGTFTDYEEKFGTVVPLYGSSEMGVIAIANSTESKEIRQNTVGKALAGVEIKLENTGISQLWCRDQFGFEGYVDEEGNWLYQTKENWFATKDLAEIDDNGYLRILGRCDYSVNRNGLLVLLTDIEKALEGITGVEKAVTVVTGESIRGKKLKIYCVLAKNAKLTETKIRNICFELLPRHAIPDEIIIVSSLPLLPNGKIDRQKLSGSSNIE